MYLSVVEVKPLENYYLWLRFENNEEKIFDIKPYLEIGKFQELKNKDLFNTVKISFDSIEWSNHLDLDPKLLYKEGVIPSLLPTSRITGVSRGVCNLSLL